MFVKLHFGLTTHCNKMTHTLTIHTAARYTRFWPGLVYINVNCKPHSESKCLTPTCGIFLQSNIKSQFICGWAGGWQTAQVLNRETQLISSVRSSLQYQLKCSKSISLNLTGLIFLGKLGTFNTTCTGPDFSTPIPVIIQPQLSYSFSAHSLVSHNSILFRFLHRKCVYGKSFISLVRRLTSVKQWKASCTSFFFD